MHPLKHNDGAIAQLVEQRTENPCVPGSIPGGTTERESYKSDSLFFYPYFVRFSMVLSTNLSTNLSTEISTYFLPHPPQQQNFIKKGQSKNP